MKRTEEALASDTTGSVLMGCEDARDAAKDGTSTLSNKAIFDAAVGGDDLALQIVDETAMYLAAGCLNFARIVDPAIIVFRYALTWQPLLSCSFILRLTWLTSWLGWCSGGPTRGKGGELLLSLLHKHVDAMTWSGLPTPTKCARASAGPDAGLIGAAFGAKAAWQKKQSFAPKL